MAFPWQRITFPPVSFTLLLQKVLDSDLHWWCESSGLGLHILELIVVSSNVAQTCSFTARHTFVGFC